MRLLLALALLTAGCAAAMPADQGPVEVAPDAGELTADAAPTPPGSDSNAPDAAPTLLGTDSNAPDAAPTPDAAPEASQDAPARDAVPEAAPAPPDASDGGVRTIVCANGPRNPNCTTWNHLSLDCGTLTTASFPFDAVTPTGADIGSVTSIDASGCFVLGS